MAAKRLSMKHAKLLRQHRYILEKLATTNKKDRQTILKNAPSDLFKVLNLVFKLLNEKNLDLSQRQNRAISKHKRLIRSASGLKGTQIKERLVKQRGGALSTILSAVLPVLGGLIQSIL